MNFWIFVLSIGVILTIVGMITWTKEYNIKSLPKNSSMILGIFLPLLFGSFYAETLMNDFFPGLTLIDLGAFYFIGMISGFFTAFYLLNRKELSTG